MRHHHSLALKYGSYVYIVCIGLYCQGVERNDLKKMEKKVYFQVFKESYNAEFPCIRKSSKGEKYAYCDVCRNDFVISHGGRNDVHRHVTGSRHVENVKLADKNKIKLMQFFKPNALQDDVMRAELLFTTFLIDHNVPLNAANHAGPLFRKMFPKSDIAKRYGCGKSKTASLVHEMAKDRTSEIVKILQEHAFTAACDGSHESDYKLYPVVVSYFNVNIGRIENTLLTIQDLVGNSTGENISSLILNTFVKFQIPFQNCIAFSADNASVMQGRKNGAISFLRKENEHIISIGCCCHLIHLASEKAASTLPVKVDEVVIDIFYYLKKSAKRKDSLKKFQDLYGKEAQKILKHVSTRWLSLGRSLSRLVNQWDPLMSFFRAEATPHELPTTLSLYKIPKVGGENVIEDHLQDKLPKEAAKTVTKKGASTNKQEVTCSKKRKNLSIDVIQAKNKKHKGESNTVLTKEEKIFMFLSSDLNKAYSLFLLNIIPSFEKVNTILQSTSPQIHRLRALLLQLLKELFSKFVKASEVKGKALPDVNFHSPSSHKDNEDLVVGSATSNLITKCSEKEQKLFYEAVIKYYVTACEYIIKKFPIKNDVLKHVEVANLENIENSSFSSIKYFIDLFPFLLKVKNGETEIEALDLLQKEFCELQLEDLSTIIVPDKEVDMQWAEVKQLRGADGMFKYERLSDVILSVLLIPHSNAECERIFSLVRKNRTESRAGMSNKTLESLLVLKTRDSKPCYEQTFEHEFLIKAKKAYMATINSASTSSHAADVEED